jgi:hypothetical protein
VKERRLYTLKEFMPVSVLDDICMEAYGDVRPEAGYEYKPAQYCFWQSLIIYVCPIKLYDPMYKGTWHPLPKGPEYQFEVTSYEQEDEG